MVAVATVLFFIMGPILMIGLGLSIVLLVDALTVKGKTTNRAEASNTLTDYDFLLTVGAVLLIATWSYILYIVWGASGWMLIPWEMWGNLRPAPGTLDRQVNDFFNCGDNQFLPALVVLGFDVAIFIVRISHLRDRARRTWLPLAFAWINAVFLAASVLGLLLLRDVADLWLPQPRPQLDFGYHRTWPVIVFYILLAGLLFCSHWKIGVPKFWRRYLFLADA